MARADQFEPIYPNHAIERCAWSVTFAQAIPDKLYRKAIQLARGEMASLGIPQLQMHIMRVDAQTGQLMPTSEDEIAGPVEFGVPDGSQSLSMTPESIAWQTTRYIRWNAFAKPLAEVARAVVGPLLDSVSVGTVKLEYWDRFFWSGTWENMSPEDLVRKDTGFIAEAAFRKNVPWHTHTGWFEEAPRAYRRLVNVNIGAQDAPYMGQPARPSIGIYTMLQDSLAMPGRDTLDCNVEDVLRHSDELHAELKVLLSKLISTDMQIRISLNHERANDEL